MFANCIFKTKIKCIAFLTDLKKYLWRSLSFGQVTAKNQSKNVDFL